MLIPVAARFMACFCDCSLAGIVGSKAVGGMDVCCECCVLTGRGLCDRPILHPEKNYRVCV